MSQVVTLGASSPASSPVSLQFTTMLCPPPFLLGLVTSCGPVTNSTPGFQEGCRALLHRSDTLVQSQSFTF